MKRMAESELSRSVNEFLSRLQDDLKEAMNTMMCSKCQGKHKRFELDRDPLSARYCAECGQLHPAEEGDFWAESSLLGLKITYFAVMDGKVYDITEWAGCQRVGICPDTHRVPYHISFGARSAGAGGRGRAGLTPPPPGSLQGVFPKRLRGSGGVRASPPLRPEQLRGWGGQAASGTFRAAFKLVSFCLLAPIDDPARPLSVNTANAGSPRAFSRDGFASPASALHRLRDAPLTLRARSGFF
uniref:Cleavage inducing molecular chaperone Jiv domain-containing protein n=1 Tax=Anser cygnoides TaxID=8845 RepID=A0A8B9EBF8_ANSCY